MKDTKPDTAGWNRISELERQNGVLRGILADRERELLLAKGACSNAGCVLHYAHSGPCNVQREKVAS